MVPLILYWLFVGLGVYVWIGYPAFALLLSLLRRRSYSPAAVPGGELSPVTVLITVYNGEKSLQRKLHNTLALDYPEQLLEVVVVSDGSDDGTERLAKEWASRGVRLIATGARVGKSAAQNIAIPAARGAVIILSDLETELPVNFAREAVRRLSDPDVGCVTGEVRWRNADGGGNAGAGGLYWRFETWLRRRESEAGMFTQASGVCMAFRKRLFRAMPEHVGDDCVIPLSVVEQGSRCVVIPGVVATDAWAPEIRSEFRARVRMTQRNMTGTLMHWRLFNPLRGPLIAWSLFSRTIMRWFTPFFVAGALGSNAFLLGRPLYVGMLTVALVAIVIAALGLAGQMAGRNLPIAGPLGSLLAVQLAFMVGVARSLSGRKVVAFRTADSSASGAGKASPL